MTNGAGDDPNATMAPMTVIFEYALPNSRTPKAWSESWHHLGTHAAFDEAYKVELAQLTEEFVKRGASPERQNGSAIAQVRTNESAFNWIWQLRQFQLDATGALVLRPVSNTPGEGLNNSPQLRDFVLSNAEKIKKDEHVLPQYMLAGSADQLLFRWKVPNVDENTRIAFARSTCNGCHSGENPPIDTAFHVSPYRAGIEKLSPFLNSKDDPAHDELSKREAWLKEDLCN